MEHFWKEWRNNPSFDGETQMEAVKKSTRQARNALARHEAGDAAKGDGAWDSSLTLGCADRFPYVARSSHTIEHLMTISI